MDCHKCKHYEDVQSGMYYEMEFSKTPCGKCFANKDQWGTFSNPNNHGCSHVSVESCPEHEIAVDPANMTREHKITVLDIAMSVADDFVRELAAMSKLDREIVMGVYRNKTYLQLSNDLRITPQAVEQRHKALIRGHPFFEIMFPMKKV